MAPRLVPCSPWLAAAVALVLAGAVLAQPAPEFKLGFKALADGIPEVAGQPVEEEHYGSNGDSLQKTTTGLMVWRKADNWTAFTDGSRTWLNGPAGIQERSNGECFDWEKAEGVPTAAATGTPVASATPLPVPSPVPPTATPTPLRQYAPDVKAMDQESANPGVRVKEWMRAIDAEWATVWGWQPARITTIYLYFDAMRMADGLATIGDFDMSPAERRQIAQSAHALASRDEQTGGWAVLVNLSPAYGQSVWEGDTRSVLIHEYAHVMQMDAAGLAGPIWFREGMAQVAAFVAVPQALEGTNRLAVTAHLSCLNQLPSLRTLNDTWGSMYGSDPQLAYGMAYFAVKQLADRVGGRPLLQVLERTAGGLPFEAALQQATSYTLDQLDAEYRTVPCTAYR